MTDTFKNKNVLALYPAEDSGFPARFDAFKPYFRSLHLLNYAEACHSAGIGNTERRIRELVSGNNIDLVLVCPFASDYQLSAEFYASLRRKTRLVFWFADDPSYFESYNRYYAQAADAVITTDYFASFAYKRLEIEAVVCQDLTAGNKYCPVRTERVIDVCFIGDMRKRGRKEYIDFLKQAGIAVEVYGQGAGGGYLPSEKISEYLCASKINLNFSQIGTLDWKNADEPLLNRVRQNPGRPREIALTGAFCLCEYSPSLETVFKPGEQIDFFRDKTELLEKVRFYLDNPGKREAIARAAHEHALKNYREDVYIPKLLGELKARLSPASGKPPELYFSKAFRAREVNSLTFSMFAMAKRLNLPAALEAFLLLFRHGPAAFLAGFPGGAWRAAKNALGKLSGKNGGK